MAAIPDALIQRAKDVDLVALIGAALPLKKIGREFVTLCPFHEEKTPSFYVVPAKGFWHCHGCGVHGDSIEWQQRQGKMNWRDAVHHLAGEEPLNGHPYVAPKGKQSFAPIFPAPSDPGDPVHPTLGKPERVFRLRDVNGNLLCFIARFNPKPKAMPYTYGTLTSETGVVTTGWHWLGPPPPRPLYGLEKLALRPDALVVVCEGEKKADAIDQLFPKWIGLSWTGGANSAKHADWEPLRGRRVLAIPDNDKPGIGAVREDVLPAVHALGCVCATVRTDGMPAQWDVADALQEGWTPDQAMKWIEGRIEPYTPPKIEPPDSEPPPIGQDDRYDEHEADAREEARQPSGLPVPLGYDMEGGHYYLCRQTGGVRRLTVEQHTKRGLMDLAPLSLWQTSKFWKETRHGETLDLDMAVDYLMKHAKERGIFDSDRRRGRGVWEDAGRWVVHLGDRLLVDGVPTALQDLRSRYVYEPRIATALPMGKPLSDDEGLAYVELCRRLDFKESWHADAIAGWTAMSMVAGAMKWRPHIFIDGATATGKGTVIRSFMRPLLLGFSLFVGLDTTAAGIRQKLAGDCVPVFFDEADSDSQRDRERMQDVINLSRGSSDEAGIDIVKGGMSGRSDHYAMRSPFCFAATNNAVIRPQDQNRFVMIYKTMPAAGSSWSELHAAVLELLTPEYAGRMFARLVEMIPTIRSNAETFADVIASISTHRSGSTLGAILAGFAALTTRRAFSHQEAEAWINEHGWSVTNAQEQKRGASDHEDVVGMIAGAILRAGANGGLVDMSVSELVDVAYSHRTKNGIYQVDADDVLARAGLLVKERRLWINCKNRQVMAIFKDSAFRLSFPTILQTRVEGAERVRQRFHGGMRPYAIGIPLNLVIDVDD